MKQQKRGLDIGSLIILVGLMAIVLFSALAAEPDGATIDFKSNSTKTTRQPSSRNDSKGTINTVVINAVQQDFKWKAYVGNVSGTLVLKDSSDYSIYEWTSIGNPTGEVYITRDNSIEWDQIECANATHISAEQTYLNHTASAGDNIENTFSSNRHQSFWIGSLMEISNSTCPSLATWVNDTPQSMSEDSLFQEILLYDNTSLVYATIIEQDIPGYRNDSSNTTYDFQALVPESALPGPQGQVTYYFYVEIEAG